MTASFRALFEQLGPLAEPRPAGPQPSPEVPDFGALADLLEPAPRPARAVPAFGGLAELLSAAPAAVPVGERPLVLIACSDTKIETKGRAVPAADLYASALFRKSLAYARAITTEENIRILSGLHGVLRTTDRIATYDFPITKLSVRERDEWGERAHTTLLGQFGQKRRRNVLVLAGEEYVTALHGLTNPHRRDALPWTITYPFGVARGERMQIGERLRWLNNQLRALGHEPPPAPKRPAPLKPGRVRLTTRGRPWREVEALAWEGDFFVHVDVDDDDIFTITHAPTGRAVGQRFTDERSAIVYAADLNSPEVRPVVAQLVEAVEKKWDGPANLHGDRLMRLLAAREPLRLAEYRRRYGQDPPADALAPRSEREPQAQLSERSPAPAAAPAAAARPQFADLAQLLGDATAVPPPPQSETRQSTKPAPTSGAWSYLGTVGGHMVWPDVGTRVRWNEDTQERRGKVVRHGTRELEGTITRVVVDEMNPRDIDVWAKPDDGGAERRLGIGGIRIPTADLPAFTERAKRWFEKRMKALYGEWPPSPPPAPPPAQTEKREIAQFLIQRAERFAPVWPRPGEVVSATNAKIASALRAEATAIRRTPDVAGQSAHDARLAALRHLRSVAAKAKGKPGEAIFVAANDIERGMHLGLAEEPASSAPDPRRAPEALKQPRPTPEPANVPSFADLVASLEATAPPERAPAAAPLSVASDREHAQIVAYLKREAAAAERGDAKLAAQRLRAVADDVAKMTMPAAELRRFVIEMLITYALLKTAEELREGKHYTKGERAAIEAAESLRSPGMPPAEEAPATVRSVRPLRQQILDAVGAQSHSAEVLAGILGVDLAAVRAEITRLLDSGAVYVVEASSEGPPEYMATAAPRAVRADAAPASPGPAPDLQAARLALPALPAAAQKLRWRVLRGILTSGRTAEEIAELLGVAPVLVREELGRLYGRDYVKQTRDPAGRVEYRADLKAIMRNRDARARDLQVSTPRPIALPRAGEGEMLIEPAPNTPGAWRVAQADASGRRIWYSRALSWADAVQAAVARDGDPRFWSDLPRAPSMPPQAAVPEPSLRASLEEAAWAATPEEYKSTRSDGTRVVNYLNPATGATESWALSSLPIEELQRRARVASAPAPAVEPAEGEADEADEGWETIPSVRAPSEHPAGPVLVAVFTDGTEVLGTPTAPGKPPLGRAYTSQTVAQQRADTLGEGWDVIKRGRRWYVRRLASAPAPAQPGDPAAPPERVPAPSPTTKLPTFAQVRKMLLAGLEARGWIVKRDLKIPHASKGRDRLWFKPQAVYFAAGMGKDIGDAHSLSSDMREFASVDDLLRAVERYSHAAAPESDGSRHEIEAAERRARVAIARYLESVAKLVGDSRAANLLAAIAWEARALQGSSVDYAKTIAERLRAAAVGEGAETFSILRRAAWGLDHGARGTTSAQAWAETREGTPEEEFEARRAEAARIEAELERLRARFPSKKRNAVREMVRDAIRKVREACVSPGDMDTLSADSAEKCDEARDALRAALATRARALNTEQGDMFDGFKDPKDIAAAQAVVKDIEALSRRLEAPQIEGFKIGDVVVGVDGEEGGTVVANRPNGNVIVEHADGTRTPWTHWGWWLPAPAPQAASQPKETSEPVEVTAARQRAQREAAELVASAQQRLEDAAQADTDSIALAGRRREKDAADTIQFAVHTPPEDLAATDMESLARFAERGGKSFLANYLRDVPPWPTATARDEPAYREKVLALLEGRRGGAPLHVITAHVVNDAVSQEEREHVVGLLRRMGEERILDMRMEAGEQWYTLRSATPSPMLEALTRLLGDEAPAREVEAAIENAAQDHWWDNIVKTRRVYGAAIRLMHDDEALADQVLDIARQFQSQVLEERPEQFVSRKAGEPPITASTFAPAAAVRRFEVGDHVVSRASGHGRGVIVDVRTDDFVVVELDDGERTSWTHPGQWRLETDSERAARHAIAQARLKAHRERHAVAEREIRERVVAMLSEGPASQRAILAVLGDPSAANILSDLVREKVISAMPIGSGLTGYYLPSKPLIPEAPAGTRWDVVLVDVGADREAVVEALWELGDASRNQARDLIARLPAAVAISKPAAVATAAWGRLTARGATARVRPSLIQTTQTPAATETAKVELYNLTDGARVVGNGFLVARYVNGARANTLREFGADEEGARAYAASWKPGTASEAEPLATRNAILSYLSRVGEASLRSLHDDVGGRVTEQRRRVGDELVKLVEEKLISLRYDPRSGLAMYKLAAQAQPAQPAVRIPSPTPAPAADEEPTDTGTAEAKPADVESVLKAMAPPGVIIFKHIGDDRPGKGSTVRVPSPRPAAAAENERTDAQRDAAAIPSAAELRAKANRARQLAEGGDAAFAFERLAEDLDVGNVPPRERVERAAELLAAAEVRDAQSRERVVRFLREKAGAAKALGDEGKRASAALVRVANQIDTEGASSRERAELLRRTSTHIHADPGARRMFGVAPGNPVDLQEQYNRWLDAGGSSRVAEHASAAPATKTAPTTRGVFHTHQITIEDPVTRYMDAWLATPPPLVDVAQWAEAEVRRRRPRDQGEWTVFVRELGGEQEAPGEAKAQVPHPKTTPTAEEQTIVVAWVAQETEIVPGNYRTDLGERPRTRVVPVAKAVLWVDRGTPADVQAARDYAAKQDTGAAVYTYAVSEPDPLGAAKRDALAKYEAGLGGAPEERVLVAVRDMPLTLATIAERSGLEQAVARAVVERLVTAGKLTEKRGPPDLYGLAGNRGRPSQPPAFGDLAELLQGAAPPKPTASVRVPSPRAAEVETAPEAPTPAEGPEAVSAFAVTKSREAFEAAAAQRVADRPIGAGAAADYAELADLHRLARDAHRAAAAVQGGSLFALHNRAGAAHARAHEANDGAAKAAREHEAVLDAAEAHPAHGKRAQGREQQRLAEEHKKATEAARAARLASEAAATVANNLERAIRGAPAPAPAAARGEAPPTPAGAPAPSPPIQVEDLWTAARRRDANLAAMRLAAEAARDPRPLTDDERRTLALYSGWGGLSIEEVAAKGGFPLGFPQPDSDALIHEYYTPTKVCAEVARIVLPLLDGVNGLAAADGYIHALEPSCGIGRFIRAFQGPGFENIRWHGVEYSPLSAAILRTLMPELDLYEGPFQRWVAEHEADYGRRLNLVVSNPPYGAIGAEIAADRKRSYRESGKSPAYKYFLRRGLDLLAPGGLGVFLIPAGFLSGTGEGYPELRKKVLLRHHISCAYRLPGEIFPGGHNPAFDLIFFRARPGTLEELDPADTNIVKGRYYDDFPQNVLGEIVQNYGRWKTEAVVGEFTSLPDLVERPICQVCAHQPFDPLPPPPTNEKVAPNRRAHVFSDARLASASTLGNRVNWFLAAVAAQESEAPVLAWEELHRGLTDWATHHGPPSEDVDVVKLAVEGDVGAQRFLNAFVKGTTKLIPGLATKPEFTPRYTGAANDLVAKAEYLYRQHRRLSRDDLGGADLSPLFAAGWCEDDDPAAGPDRMLEPPDVYYFGQLWPKYDRAKARAELGDEQAARQAAKLIELIRPAVFDDIRLAPPPPPAPKPGAPPALLVWPPPPAWLPLDLLAEWIRHENPQAEGEINLARKDGVVKLVDETYEELGEGNYGGRTEVVNMIGWINHDKYLFGPAKTGAETLDQARMRVSKAWSQSFVAWAGATPERRERIEQAYQRIFQGFRAPEYGSEPLNLARWYKGVTLAPHQNAGARRVLANRGGLVAFDVGVGKTYTGLGIIAGARQEGWVKRPVIVVPASIIWKWDRDIRKCLPDYRVGIVGSRRKTITRDTKKHKKGYETSETDTPADRAATWSRFQAGEYDVVLMTYEALARTRMREASVVEYARATAGIQRQMTLRKRNLERRKKLTEREEAVLKQGVAGWVAQLLELPESWQYDPGIVWEDIGIDMLMFDEAQRGKNLYMPEAREAGVPKYMGSEGEGSAIAWQMDFRCATVRANTGGAGIVLLSATPAKNSPLEFYNAIQFIDHDAWTRIGITNPEQFIDIFCEIEVRHVVNTSTMEYGPQSVCSGFINLDMLRSVIFKYGEFKTAEDVGLPLPTPKVDIIEVDMTDEQEDKYSEYLDRIAEAKAGRRFGEAAGYRMRLPLVAIHVDLDEGYTWPTAVTKVVGAGESAVETEGIVEPDDGVVLSVRDALAIPRRVKKNVFGTSDPYKTLGIQRTATADEISDAFRLLARQHHPDTNPGDEGAAARFKEINAAYQLLSDPQKRAAYDHDAALGALAGEGKKKVVKKSAADVPNPHSPKFDALVKEILARPHCGHIVFCDNIAAHWWIKTCLEQAGIAPERIAVMNGIVAKEVVERQKIALAFNGDDGDKGDPARGIEPMPPIPPEYDVVIGNAIMYEGVDLQRRTCAIHHLDLPYEPSTLQQRNGRGHRQGNKFTEISILYYFARRSSDGGRYQLIKGKLGWMTALLDNQQRDTNNPGAQSNMTPEEEAIFESRDPEATRRLIEAAKERHQAEVNAKVAHEASATLRGVADRFWRARNAKDAEEAARMRAEGEQKLAELARVNPVAWPWMSWAVHARDVMMLVPPNGESPVYPGLRLAKPHFSDPTVKDYSEFGRTFEGKSIGIRRAGSPTWTELELAQLVAEQIKPEHLAEDWPADDDEQIAELMRSRLLPRLAQGGLAKDVWNRELQWHWASPQFVERQWPRFGEQILTAWKRLPSHWQGELKVPVITNGVLSVGILRPFDFALPPTDEGYAEFLRLALPAKATWGELDEAARFWWGRSIPRNLVAAREPEKKTKAEQPAPAPMPTPQQPAPQRPSPAPERPTPATAPMPKAERFVPAEPPAATAAPEAPRVPKAAQVPEAPKVQARVAEDPRSHVHRVGNDVYGDTQLLGLMGRLPGYTVRHLGMGEFTVATPLGDIEFDRMRGVDFPGQSGRSHLLYGEPKALAAALEALGLGDLVPRPPPGPARAGAEHVRVVSDMVFADDAFKDAARGLPGNAMQMVQGRHELRTPEGLVIFDPEGGAPARVGMTYMVRGRPNVVAALLDAMGLGDLAPGRPAPATPAPPAAPRPEGAEHVRQVGARMYADDTFLDAAGKLPGNAVAPMGQGEFVLRTPRGIIGFDPRGGVPDKVGFTYLLSGFPEVITPLLEAMGIGELVAEPEPAAPVKRPLGEYRKLPQTGTWGIAVPGPAPKPGEKVTVTTRKGKVKTEVIDRVVGSGYTSTGQPATLCSVVE